MEYWVDNFIEIFEIALKVGNKIDLPNREVTTREASEFARDNGCFYMETSALDGTGVNQAFYKGTCLKLFKFLVKLVLIGFKSLENEIIKAIYLVAFVSLFPLLVFLWTVLLYNDCIF